MDFAKILMIFVKCDIISVDSQGHSEHSDVIDSVVAFRYEITILTI